MHRSNSDVRQQETGVPVQVPEPICDRKVWFKRVQDVTLASLALFIFGPSMLAIALAVKVESRGPALVRQRTVGLNGVVFNKLKFRSTYELIADRDRSAQASDDTFGTTRMGGWLRATGLDGLPQFINILQGSMSVVGPIAYALKSSREALDAMGKQYALHVDLRPGLTGWAQVNGCNGGSVRVDELRRRTKFELEYLDNRSLTFDLRIVLRSVARLLIEERAT